MEFKQITEHIEFLKKHLDESENNLQYITALQALKYSLEALETYLYNATILKYEYKDSYLAYFYEGNELSFYDKVCKSFWEYQRGNRPF